MRTCLVIDDSSIVRKVAGRIIASFDTATAEAASGAEGLAAAENTMPNLVLVSGNLSDMSGEDFIRRLRALEGGAAVPVIALLVESNLGQMTRLKRAGASGFALKPFDRMSLSMRLETYLRLAEAA
ncbi:response regulator [Aureimonas psammosilenae]|uniref:response regulator n=1 Tax=Aureimonas psammosilenae TaxID=2495496 RepID=UPI001260D769|nr:response regulator [Aureimonas psammosilenae]